MYSTICQQYLNKIRGKNLKITIFKNLFSWEFPGSPGVRLHASNTGAWVLSLVRELRPHISRGMPPQQKTKGLSYLLWTIARQEVNRNRGVGERNMALWTNFLIFTNGALNLRRSRQLEKIPLFLNSLIQSTFTQQWPWTWRHCRMH